MCVWCCDLVFCHVIVLYNPWLWWAGGAACHVCVCVCVCVLGCILCMCSETRVSAERSAVIVVVWYVRRMPPNTHTHRQTHTREMRTFPRCLPIDQLAGVL